MEYVYRRGGWQHRSGGGRMTDGPEHGRLLPRYTGQRSAPPAAATGPALPTAAATSLRHDFSPRSCTAAMSKSPAMQRRTGGDSHRGATSGGGTAGTVHHRGMTPGIPRFSYSSDTNDAVQCGGRQQPVLHAEAGSELGTSLSAGMTRDTNQSRCQP